MIAMTAHYKYLNNEFVSLEIAPSARWKTSYNLYFTFCFTKKLFL
jgi:hypothetical protein